MSKLTERVLEATPDQLADQEARWLNALNAATMAKVALPFLEHAIKEIRDRCAISLISDGVDITVLDDMRRDLRGCGKIESLARQRIAEGSQAERELALIRSKIARLKNRA